MNSLRRVTTSAILALLVFAIWSSVTHSHDNPMRAQMAGGRPNRGMSSGDNPTTDSAPQNQQPNPGLMSAEEKLVRDVYTRLMRYQSAAVDELAAKAGREAQPDDYLVFELRGIHSGAIQEIYARPLAEFLTARGGDSLSLKPNSRRQGKEIPHASYGAEWSPAGSAGARSDSPASMATALLEKANPATVANLLAQLGSRFANVTQYTSYEVTMRLNGKQRTYRALVLFRPNSVGKATYRTEAERTSILTDVEIVDPLISEMTTVLMDESPRIRAPWDTYSKTTLYQAVIRSINTAKESGQPLIPANAPIGYLPGDDVTPTGADTLALLANTACRDLLILRDDNDITNTTQNVVVGERINLSLETNPQGESPTNIQWSIGGQRVANYTPTLASSGLIKLENLTSPAFTFYWVKAGQQIEVSVTATIFGATVTKYAYFNVVAPDPYQPTVTMPLGGQLFIRNLADCSGSIPGPNMVFGDITGPFANCNYHGTAGIMFTAPATTSPPGSFHFVQLVTADTIVYNYAALPPMICTATNAPGLDGSYPYSGQVGLMVSDAPFHPLISTTVSSTRDFAATMYLMWKSNTTGAIPVSMGSVHWTVSGLSTKQADGSWVITSGSGSPDPFVASSGENSMPQWTGLVHLANTNCH